MRITRWLMAACSCVLFSMPAAAQPDRITKTVDDGQRVKLAENVDPRARPQDDQGRADPMSALRYVTLALKPTGAQQSALERLLEEQQDRSSANFHRWLTPEQFGDRFGVSARDLARVRAWIESQGFHVEDVARARNWVAFSGTVATAETAFRTEIHRYSTKGERHFANATELSIPAALGDVVRGVRGLDDFWRRDRALPEYTLPSGVIELAPDDWTTIYDVKPLYAAGIDGTGQRLAILGTSDFPQSFMDSFRSMFGLPPSQIEMHLVGPDPGVTSSESEAALDLEWSGAIARNAQLVYVYATNFNDAAQAAIDQDLATVMSQSFGTCEPSAVVGNRALAQQANAEGITWMASSGDSGGAGCDPHGFFGATGNSTPAMAGLWVDLPAGYPEVTAVGGTEFNEGSGQYWAASNNANGGSALGYIPEMVWNETGPGGLLASGGGASTYFPKPAWQAGPGVPNDYARDVPDVSFSASGNHDPYAVVNANGLRATGGTSASSPSFAGVVALLNQYVVSKGIQPAPGLGNINPELYRLAQTATNVFHDITVGNNVVPCASGSLNCVTGSFGFNAGPGYDQATGLGSIDVNNLFQAWNTPSAVTTTSVTVNPSGIVLGSSAQVTATVTGSAAGPAPTGTVTFSCGGTILGTAALEDFGSTAMATLTVEGLELPVGNATVTGTYSGDGNFNGSTGTAVVNVTASSSGSAVAISISPNPAHEGQYIRVTLTEVGGVGTTITDWSINGVDNFYRFATDFGGTTLAPYGTLFTGITSAFPAVVPSNRVYSFSGVDGNGRQWSQQYTLVLQGALSPGALLASAPSTVLQNLAADASCQWSHLLILTEQNDMEVQITRVLANSADWSNRIDALFGTSHLAPLGNLQATICWPSGTPQQSVNYEVDGIDQSGNPVAAKVVTTLAGPPASPAPFSVSPAAVRLSAANSSQAPSAAISVNAGANQPWSVGVYMSDAAANWLAVSPTSGTGPATVTVTAIGAGMSAGVQYAWLVFQSANGTPQFVEVPLAFVVGASGAISIGGVTNSASFKQVFAPGMIMSVFGTGLASAAQSAASLPLPLTMGGASATVNGVAAPLYYVSPNMMNIQIPYETGAGPAVLGVNYNGQAASAVFTVAPSAPGIFADSSSALVPTANAMRGDILTLYMTGEGDVSPALVTGATPFLETPLNLLPAPIQPVSVTIGGVAAPIAFAGIPPGLAGVTQINFTVPENAPAGVQSVIATVGGVLSAPVKLTVR